MKYRVLLTLTMLGLFVSFAACPAPPPATSHNQIFEVHESGTASVFGLVKENDRGCEVDGSCLLILGVGKIKVTVVYHTGMSPICINEKAAREGIAVEPGDYVEAFGAYEENGERFQISTCPDLDFYIRKLEPLS